MGFDLSLHHVRTMTAELLVDPVSLTLRFEQSVPALKGGSTPDSVEVSVFVTKDQDAEDAFLLAAAINCSSLGTDDLEDRRRRAAMALGWTYVDAVEAVPGLASEAVPGHWERPWREGDATSDDPQWAEIVEDCLRIDLGAI